MQIGMTLPSMVEHYTRDTTLDWCGHIDRCGYSTVACGERITYHNQEILVLLSAAAALTARVRIMPTLFVLPMHSAAWLAKQTATLDVLSGGRLTVSVGVGGRQQDYRAIGSDMPAKPIKHMTAQVAEMRRFWAGEPPFPGSDPIGPLPAQAGGPPVYAGAMRLAAVRKAAAWADGVMGSVISGDPAEILSTHKMTRDAWQQGGGSSPPRQVSAVFYALGSDAETQLKSYAYDYLKIFGDDIAKAGAGTMQAFGEDGVRSAVDAFAEAGFDELLMVPTASDVAELQRFTELMSKHGYLSA